VNLDRYKALLVLVLLLGGWLRLTGLTRGASDFVLPEQGTREAFYAFHPDEETLVRAALELESPLRPPLTAYGLLPLYLARGALWLAGEQEVDGPPQSRQKVFAAVRLTSALLSWMSLGLVWGMGRWYAGPGAALLATFFVALAPLAIQQAHFFAVDGVFTAVVLFFFWVLMREGEGYGRWVLAGVLAGAAGAVRLNGLALLLVLAARHCAAAGNWRKAPGRLLDPRLGLAGLAAIGMLAALQPYLVFEPALIQQARTTDDWVYSLQVARGQVLRPWTLADLHTTPYLHYWTHLWPLGVGWPLTLAFAGGLIHAAGWRWPRGLPLLLWCALYFAMVGGLHTKHVRYLLPLLPFLSLLAADLVLALRKRHSLAGGLALFLVAGYAAAHGLAFARIYRVEDSRIQAGRWLAENAPEGSRIGVESGGFSMQGLISETRHRKQALNLGTLFGARAYLSCAPAVDFLREQVGELEYLALVEENRYRQFTAAAELYPVPAQFYWRLWSGELGFALARRFREYPSLGGVQFSDAGAEPSFTGYDHPAVLILRRQAEAIEMERLWAGWKKAMEEDEQCADKGLKQVAGPYLRGEWEEARGAAEEVLEKHPGMRTTHFLKAAIHHRLGQDAQEREATRRYMEGYGEENAYLVPWATAMTLLALELPDEALAALDHGKRLVPRLEEETLRKMAASYVQAGNLAYARGLAGHAGAAYQLAIEVHPESHHYAALGMALYAQGRLEESAQAYARALELDERDAAARVNYGWNLFLLGRLPEAVAEFERVLHQTPSSAAMFNLGLAYLAQGKAKEAEETYARAVEQSSREEAVRLGAVAELRALVEKGVQAEAGKRILERYWPVDDG
jgi:tetratricopeptide (TPR) repeat protein